MGFFIVLAILAAAQSFLGIEIVNTPPTKDWHKWFWRGAFIIIAVVMVILGAIQFHEQDKEAQDTNSKISGLTNQVTTLTQNNLGFSNQIVVLTSQNAQLIEEFSTNSGIEPIIRLGVLNDEEQKISKQIEDLQNQHEVLKFDGFKLSSMRNEESLQNSNRTTLSRYQSEQAAIQKQIGYWASPIALKTPRFSLTVNIPDVVNVDKLDGNFTISNYVEAANIALRHLIEAQDVQFPLDKE